MNQIGWNKFIKLCLQANNEAILSTILELLLTPEEKSSIAMRYLIIIELIKQNKTQRTIAKDLQVSIAKITRGSNELKRTSPELLDFFNNNISD